MKPKILHLTMTRQWFDQIGCGAGNQKPHTRSMTNDMTSLFGEPIYTYTRAQALLDGGQVAVPPKTSAEAGLSLPVYLTRAVWDAYVTVPPKVQCQDESGRLWDILWMTRFAIMQGGNAGSSTIPVELYVRNTNRNPKLVRLRATCGPLDIDDPQPVITIMLPDED